LTGIQLPEKYKENFFGNQFTVVVVNDKNHIETEFLYGLKLINIFCASIRSYVRRMHKEREDKQIIRTNQTGFPILVFLQHKQLISIFYRSVGFEFVSAEFNLELYLKRGRPV
jgi:hypothetical protein